MTDTIVLAEHHTRNYVWRAIGRTEAEALQALHDAWAEHCRHTTVGDTDMMRHAIEQGDVNVYTLVPGMAMRDDTILVKPAEPEAVRSYCTGLPVVMDVMSDGTVRFEPDLSEATDDLWEAAPTDDRSKVLYTDEEIEADIKVIDAAVNRHYAALASQPEVNS